ncbi:hypothetical protein Lgee_1154 [Legionella geestiana]|uniref:Lipopolysaccharide export system permease protein LptF n=1 Tax=Legionella geestiana TaxID=45065 RepID=A0A0W0TVY7_9GAMM|nr:LPS export ABC transporter permease LptF [Legionella geestiana]KTC99662.1 hypothetical protein Lgee_1154 [Legionella geestiana]QBS13215.1 LPS export ABC transporter permease LptF [Legionella geestiana]STX54263.1 permease [Legionella geestiana]
MRIFRYLAKEVFVTLASLTTILMLIFMSNQFVRYLNRAASGQFPVMAILKLMMLELPNLMGLLLPLGFFMALLIAYGRLYAESEMTVLRACGYGQGQLLRHSLWMAAVVAVIVGCIMIWFSPAIAAERARLLRTTGLQTLIQTVPPGSFQSVSRGRDVFYIEALSRDRAYAENVFLARQTRKGRNIQWDVLWAERANTMTDPETHEDFVILKDGRAYGGVPGLAAWQLATFESYTFRLPHPVMVDRGDFRTAETASLLPLNNPDRRKAAELQWRLAVPIMALVLTLVGVPLSRVNPRAGKFASLVPAIVIYIVYANFIFIARNWIISGKLPVWLGMWWLHLAVALLGVFLFWRNERNPA